MHSSYFGLKWSMSYLRLNWFAAFISIYDLIIWLSYHFYFASFITMGRFFSKFCIPKKWSCLFQISTIQNEMMVIFFEYQLFSNKRGLFLYNGHFLFTQPHFVQTTCCFPYLWSAYKWHLKSFVWFGYGFTTGALNLFHLTTLRQTLLRTPML